MAASERRQGGARATSQACPRAITPRKEHVEVRFNRCRRISPWFKLQLAQAPRQYLVRQIKNVWQHSASFLLGGAGRHSRHSAGATVGLYLRCTIGSLGSRLRIEDAASDELKRPKISRALRRAAAPAWPAAAASAIPALSEELPSAYRQSFKFKI